MTLRNFFSYSDGYFRGKSVVALYKTDEHEVKLVLEGGHVITIKCSNEEMAYNILEDWIKVIDDEIG